MSERPRNIRRSADFYKLAVKLLRSYVSGLKPSDGYDLRFIDQWTSAMKGRVTRAFKAVDKLRARPHKVVRPRRADHLKRLQEASQHKRKIKGLKVAFVPVADPEEPVKISYRKDAVVVKQRRVGKWYVKFNKKNLLTDPDAEIRRVLAKHPARVYNIGAEHYFIRDPLYSIQEVQREVERLQNKYNDEKYDPDDTNSKFHGNWLDGVIAYNYETPADGRDYRAIRRRYKKGFKKQRKAHKRKVMQLVQKRRQQRDKLR